MLGWRVLRSDNYCIETVVPQPSPIQSEKRTDMLDRIQPRNCWIVSPTPIRVTCTTTFCVEFHALGFIVLGIILFINGVYSEVARTGRTVSRAFSLRKHVCHSALIVGHLVCRKAHVASRFSGYVILTKNTTRTRWIVYIWLGFITYMYLTNWSKAIDQP